MKNLYLLPVVIWAALFCLGTPLSAQRSHREAHSASNARSPRVTRANLVSYRLKSIGMRFQTTFAFEKSLASIQRNTRAYPQNARVAWKLKEWEITELLKRINAANYPALKSNYDDPHVFDAGVSISELTIQSAKTEKPLVYSVRVYGRQAPKTYYDLTSYLWKLEEKKMPRERPLFPSLPPEKRHSKPEQK